jgi:hypothetical protein
MTFAKAVGRNDITRSDRDLLYALQDETPRGYVEAWFGNKRLASILGKCKRTVQIALAHLKSLGLIDIVRDYGRKARRRIILLWRPGAQANLFSDPQNGATFLPPVEPEIAPTETIPPDPPIEVPEGKKEELTTNSEVVVDSFSPDHKATMQAATEILGASPGSVAKITRLIAQNGRDAIDKAIEIMRPKIDRGRLDSPWGYLHGILRVFQREGLPEPIPVYSAATTEAAVTAFMEFLHPELRS